MLIFENVFSISTDFMAQQLSPSYLKISGNSFFMLTLALSNEEKVPEPQRNIPKEIWKNFHEWIRYEYSLLL